MSEDQLRLGVVRLKLESGDELSVRASDIVACIGPSDEKRIRDGIVAMEMAQRERAMERAMMDAIMYGQGALRAGDIRQQQGLTTTLVANATLTANRLVAPNQGYAIATNPTRSDTSMIVLRSVQQVYHVTNSREEIEGWMRDE